MVTLTGLGLKFSSIVIDYAGGSLILAEAGGMATTIEGEKIFNYGLKPRSVVAAATPALFSLWKTWIDANWKPVRD